LIFKVCLDSLTGKLDKNMITKMITVLKLRTVLFFCKALSMLCAVIQCTKREPHGISLLTDQ